MDTTSYANFARTELDKHIAEFDVKIPAYLETRFGVGAKEYHPLAEKVVDAFKDFIMRPAKRLRGSFVLHGYQLAKGVIDDWVYDAAIAFEVMHAYILIMDDFQDLSPTRRGKPTIHEMFKHHFDDNYVGDAAHYGISIASLCGMLVSHEATKLILELNTTEAIKNKAAHFLNDVVVKTVFGQIHDTFNQSIEASTEHDVMEVHRLKTAYYTYYGPIVLGLILAGAAESEFEKIKQYAEPAGIAFQIQDDILGTFGDPGKTGKSNMTDIMEGKATLLTVKAIEKATTMERNVLYSALGDRQLDQKPSSFKKVLEVIERTGALEYSKKISLELVAQAKQNLVKLFPDKLNNDGFKFIAGIADYMVERDL